MMPYVVARDIELISRTMRNQDPICDLDAALNFCGEKMVAIFETFLNEFSFSLIKNFVFDTNFTEVCS